MKKTVLVCMVLTILGVCVQADVITITNTINSQQGDLRSSKDGGAFASTGSSVVYSALVAGELSTGMSRPELKFGYDSSVIPSGHTVQSAVLRLYVTLNTLTASGDGSQVLVYASQTKAANTAIVASDFEDSTFTLAGTWSELNSLTAVNQWYEFDVTSVVLNDLALDSGASSGSAFRLQLNNDVQLSNATPYTQMKFDDNSQTYLPQLVITTIPEPATIGMLGLGTLGLMLIRRIRHV